jgi:hypothetical protein
MVFTGIFSSPLLNFVGSVRRRPGPAAASGDGPSTADDWDCDLLRKKEFNIVFWPCTSRYLTYLFPLWCRVSTVEGKSMTEGRVNILQVSSPRSSARRRANKVIRRLRKMASVDDFYQFNSSKGQRKHDQTKDLP